MSSRAPQRLELREHGVGVEVRGVSLADTVPAVTVAALKKALHTHKVLLFRGQGRLPAQRQLEISQWFGLTQNTGHKHKESPHPDIFRVSNDSFQGCTQVGTSGWHIDGAFLECPFKVQTMHFWSCSRGGNTLIAPFSAAVSRVDADKLALWKRLSVINQNTTHPLISRHPVTGEVCMTIHCGQTDGFILDATLPERRVLSVEEAVAVLHDVADALDAVAHSQEWQEGDFVIMDNLAVAHVAHPDTQKPRDEVGLRIMHRTTIVGDHKPQPFDVSSAVSASAVATE